MKPFKEAAEEFNEAVVAGTAKALHVGTVKEIEEVKKDRGIESSIKKIEERLEDLEVKTHKGIIEIPDIFSIFGLPEHLLGRRR